MKKTLAFVSAALAASALALTSLAEPSDWAVAEIAQATGDGYVQDAIQSDYQNNITRGEFATLAVNYVASTLGYSFDEFATFMAEGTHGYHALSEPFGTVKLNYADTAFTDTDDAHIRIAACMGIVFGTGNGLFEPDAPITREQAATMLLRTYYSYSAAVSFDGGTTFADADLIDDWADLGVRFCVRNGVMKGVSATEFDPDGFYTREQAIVTFARMSNDKTWMDSNADSLYPIKTNS